MKSARATPDSVANKSNRGTDKKTWRLTISQLHRIPLHALGTGSPSGNVRPAAGFPVHCNASEAMQKDDALMRTYDFYFANGARNVSSQLKEIERHCAQASP
ncbi:MAG TPA: hypothetical protein VJS30_23175 [Paraburkholderia sp.]|nr:hypothetical protein [Paraburkholderia sp.]